MKIKFAIFAAFLGIAFVHGDLLALPPVHPPQFGCPEQLENPFSIFGGTRYEFTPILCTEQQLNVLLCPCAEAGFPSTWQCMCNPGYKVYHQSYDDCSCDVCPANTYSEIYNAIEGCVDCPSGTKTVGTTAADHDSIDDCVPIITCPAGEYANLVTETCVKCPVGAKDTSGTDVHGSSVSPGNNMIYKCFMPAGTYKDKSGTFETATSCNVDKFIIDPFPVVTP